MNEKQKTSRVHRPLVFMIAALMVGGVLPPELAAAKKKNGSVRHSSKTGPQGNTRTSTTRTRSTNRAPARATTPARRPATVPAIGTVATTVGTTPGMTTGSGEP